MVRVAERPLGQGDAVAVVDDRAEDAELTASLVREAGFVPIIIAPLPTSIDRLLEQIRDDARGLICDHRLADMADVDYYGAEVVAKSNENSIPAVLITTYADVESNSIRLWRSRIPRLLHRGRAADPDAIFEALAQADGEAKGRYEAGRKAYRTVVRVEEVREVAGVRVAEVVVPAWNPSEVVEIPLALIGDEAARSSDQLRGKRFMAYVNIYAEAADELYFRDFEEAPEVPEGWPD